MGECNGCLEEMKECYKWQKNGYDAGLDWWCGHYFVIVMDKDGRFIIE